MGEKTEENVSSKAVSQDAGSDPEALSPTVSKEAGEAGKGCRLTDVDVLGRHARFREKVTHEDTLINHRKTWLLLSQTFLFGALVLLQTSSKAEHISPLLTWILIAVGLSSALATLLGVWAASKAIKATKERWLSEANPVCPKERDSLPAIVGGNETRFTVFLGFCSSFTLPIVLSAVWIYLAYLHGFEGQFVQIPVTAESMEKAVLGDGPETTESEPDASKDKKVGEE